jgi:hypothetical protein
MYNAVGEMTGTIALIPPKFVSRKYCLLVWAIVYEQDFCRCLTHSIVIAIEERNHALG